MFIGHFGVGFAAKKLTRTPSLGTLFLAAQFIDLLWPIFLIFGIEKVIIDPGNTPVNPFNFIHYPFSHSLVAVIIWALLFGLIYFVIKKNIMNSIWLGILVVSHWVLDFLTHRPDLPLFPTDSSPLVGLGLWYSKIGTIVIETGIFLLGFYFYVSVTKAKNKTGIHALWSLVAFFLLIYVMNFWGPAPESADAIGYVGLSQWLFIAWAYWIDKNRELRVV